MSLGLLRSFLRQEPRVEGEDGDAEHVTILRPFTVLGARGETVVALKLHARRFVLLSDPIKYRVQR